MFLILSKSSNSKRTCTLVECAKRELRRI